MECVFLQIQRSLAAKLYVGSQNVLKVQKMTRISSITVACVVDFGCRRPPGRGWKKFNVFCCNFVLLSDIAIKPFDLGQNFDVVG